MPDRIDILAACASGGRRQPMVTKASMLDSELPHLVAAMNYYGTGYCVNAVVLNMKSSDSGDIITVASAAPLRPLGNVEDCAKGVAFLIAGLSNYVSGQCIAVDGRMVGPAQRTAACGNADGRYFGQAARHARNLTVTDAVPRARRGEA